MIFEKNSEPAAKSVKKTCGTGISLILRQFDIREEQGAPNCRNTERAFDELGGGKRTHSDQESGPTSYGLIQALREKHVNVVDYKPKGEKEERLISQIDLFEGGSVLLPKEAPWLEEFVTELLSFPGRHDNQVDALAQGLAWRTRGLEGAACTAKDNRTRRLSRYPDTKSNGQVCKSLNQLKYLICSSSRAENSQFRAAKTKDSDPVEVPARCKSRLRASLGV